MYRALEELHLAHQLPLCNLPISHFGTYIGVNKEQIRCHEVSACRSNNWPEIVERKSSGCRSQEHTFKRLGEALRGHRLTVRVVVEKVLYCAAQILEWKRNGVADAQEFYSSKQARKPSRA